MRSDSRSFSFRRKPRVAERRGHCVALKIVKQAAVSLQGADATPQLTVLGEGYKAGRMLG